MEPQPPEPALRDVYPTTELVDAEAIRLLLEGNGIPATVENRWSGMSTMDLVTSAARFAVAVPTVNAAEAERIIREAPKPVPTSSNRKLWIWVAILIGGPIVLGWVIDVVRIITGRY